MTTGPYPRILPVPDGSFFLFGVRGVGKSTWARANFPTATRVDLLDEGQYHSFLSDPAAFGDVLRTLPQGSQVVVDEVQRLPSLLNEVHRFIEERRLRFALLGSSARKLRTAGTNLLAGRAIWKTIYPLTPAELGPDFNLERVLRFGAVPLIWTAADPEERLRAYVRLYLSEEIKAEALVRNLPAFARFLPVAALFHGQVINVATLARDAGVARTTVGGYVDILEDTLLTQRLRAYEGRLRVRERRHPKLYWVDPGLARAAKRQTGPVAIEERGALLEGWVFTLLRTYAEIHPLFDEIYYWASARVEVDFLLERAGEFLAIEVKSTPRLAPSQLAGLRAIAELPALTRRVLVYAGALERTTDDGIEVWPIDTFVSRLAAGQLWP